MAHGDAPKGKWRRNWWMEWVASTLHTTSEHGVSSITTADAHTSATSSRLNWGPRRFIMDSSVSQKDEIWFLRVCHHISNAVYTFGLLDITQAPCFSVTQTHRLPAAYPVSGIPKRTSLPSAQQQICLHPLSQRCRHLCDRSNGLSTSLYFCTEVENRYSFRDVTSCFENWTVGPAAPILGVTEGLTPKNPLQVADKQILCFKNPFF
jgi:hypothetical protein